MTYDDIEKIRGELLLDIIRIYKEFKDDYTDGNNKAVKNYMKVMDERFVEHLKNTGIKKEET